MFNVKRYLFLICISCMTFLNGSQSCIDTGTLLFDVAKLQKIFQEPIFSLFGVNGNVMRPILTNPSMIYYHGRENTFSNVTISGFLFLSGNNGIFFNGKHSAFGFINLVGTAKKIMEYGTALQNTQYELLNFPFLAESINSVNIQNKAIGFTLEGTYQLDEDLFLYTQIPFVYNILHPWLPSEVQGRYSTAVGYIFDNNSVMARNNDMTSIDKKSSRDVIIEKTVVDSFGIANTIIGLGRKFCDEKIFIEGRVFLPGYTIKSAMLGGNMKKGLEVFPRIPMKIIIDSLIEQKELPSDLMLDIQSAFSAISNRVVLGSYYYEQSDDFWRISPSLVLQLPIGYSFYADCYLTYIYSFNMMKPCVAMCANDTHLAGKIAEINSISSFSDKTVCELIDNAFSVWEHYLVPGVFYGTWVPGNQFQGSFSLRSQVPDMTIACGVDTWYQGQSTCIPQKQGWIVNIIDPAVQCNLFFNFEYYFTLCCLPVAFQCMVQATVFNRNIQEQYGGKLSFSVEY